MSRYYETTHANVHRGVYETAEEATALYERARLVAGRFIGAPDAAHEVVFAKNTTEALNLVAQSWAVQPAGRRRVLLTKWSTTPTLCVDDPVRGAGGLDLRYIPIDDSGHLVLDDLDRLVDGVKVVGLSTMSNVLGTIPPVRHIASVAHEAGAVVVADGAQLVPPRPGRRAASSASTSSPSRPQDDGPTGIGVLWGRPSCSPPCRPSSVAAA